jgi:hypothetical protein
MVKKGGHPIEAWGARIVAVPVKCRSLDSGPRFAGTCARDDKASKGRYAPYFSLTNFCRSRQWMTVTWLSRSACWNAGLVTASKSR